MDGPRTCQAFGCVRQLCFDRLQVLSRQCHGRNTFLDRIKVLLGFEIFRLRGPLALLPLSSLSDNTFVLDKERTGLFQTHGQPTC